MMAVCVALSGDVSVCVALSGDVCVSCFKW